MSLLPFDPGRAKGAEPQDHLSVTQAARLIRDALERHLPSPLRVIGQVSNLSCQHHWFFSLKDERSVLRCVAWASDARGFGFEPSEGTEVIATGHVSHYAPQGSTQLYVTALSPVGAGALELRFRAMCDELRRLGYFEEARKKPLPPFPRRIAVITSAAGAALQDVIATAAHRCPAVGLVILDVRVQGDGAAQQIARAIRAADRRAESLGIDAILVTRGGGSAEDLWAFNERVVADAAYRCRLPLVAAVGHESDTSVIELVADLRAATPTAAVMRLVPATEELRRQVQHHGHRLRLVVARLLEGRRQRLELLAGRPVFRDPAELVRQARARLDRLEQDLARTLERHARQRALLAEFRRRLSRAAVVRLAALRQRADALARQLDGLDPHAVLARGYSYTTTSGGRLVRSVGDVRAGDGIVTRVGDGSIESLVGKTRKGR